MISWTPTHNRFKTAVVIAATILLTTSLSPSASAATASTPSSHQSTDPASADPAAAQQEPQQRTLGAFNLVEGVHYVMDERGNYVMAPETIDRMIRARDELRDEIKDLVGLGSIRSAQIVSCDLMTEWHQSIAAGAREEADLAWKAESSARLGAHLWRGTTIASLGAIIVLIIERWLGPGT